MPLGAFRLNSLGKFTITAAAEVIRRKLSMVAVGDAQIDTAQSKFGGAAALFDGTGDYITVSGEPSNTVKFAAGEAFTIECWIRHNGAQLGEWNFYWGLSDSRASGQRELILGSRVSASTGGVPRMFFATDTTVMIADSGVQMATNTWYHLAVVRTAANYWYVFRDGTIVFEGSTGANQQMGNGNGFKIGALGDGTLPHRGWIDEMRISKTARYTAAFTPSTTPFVNDDNTVFLSHMDGTDAVKFFEDDNGVRTSRGITAIGNAQILTNQSKFGGSSVYFDGIDDYLIANGDFSQTGDFTIECWFRANRVTGAQILMTIGNEASERATVYLDGSTLKYDTFSTGTPDITCSGTISTGVWYHVAVVRSGSTITVYRDGTSVGTGSKSGTVGNATNAYFGADSNSISDYQGWIDEIRYSNTARYTANFTAPTSPFTNDANTLLLMHMDGTNASTVFRDDNGARIQRGIQALGNAQILTNQSKFGGSSAYFDGAGDYLLVENTTANPISFGSNNFTIETWYRANTRFTGYPALICNYPTTNYITNSWVLLDRHADVNTKFTFWIYNHSASTPILTSSTSVANGTWYHLAIVRNGNTIKMYVNGTEEASATFSGSIDGGTNPGLSIGRANTANTEIQGWIDELRLSNTARYTANFTAPTAPFQNDSNTLLLMHMDGTNTSTVFIDDNGKTPS